MLGVVVKYTMAISMMLAFTCSGVSAQAPQFSNETASAGLAGVTFIPGVYNHATYTGPVVCGDFDRDGWQDLFVPSGGGAGIPDHLFINDGDGTFTDRAAEWGLTDVHMGKGAAVGDFNNDGWLDIYVTSAGSGITGSPENHRLYRNSGSGTFSNVAVSAGVNVTSSIEDGFGCCFGDYDLDGDLDLFVAGFASNNSGNRLFRNNGNETFTDMTAAIGLFSGISGTSGFAPRFQDMNGDFYPELLLIADFGTSHYFRNDTDGTFTEISNIANTAQEENGMGQTVGDYNNDGLIDWYVTSIYRPNIGWTGNKLYINQGNHSYQEISGSAGVYDGGYGWGAISIDVDHDRFVDIIETNGAGGQFDNEQSYFFRNLGNNTFNEQSISSGLIHDGFGRGILNFDSDNDGDQDVVIAGNYENLRYFRNDTPAGSRHWVSIFLDNDGDPDVAADGVGAKVHVITDSGSLYRWIDVGDNFSSQSEMSAHFGLGFDDQISEIRVIWPDGLVQSGNNFSVDQIITWHRGSDSLIRGDANTDLQIDISDPVLILGHLFGGAVLPCQEAAEVNGDGSLDISDPVYLLGYAFGGGAPPPAPFPECGVTVSTFPCDEPGCP